MESIRQLTVASKLDPRLVSDLEVFFPEWLESLGTSGTYMVLDAGVYREHMEHEEKWRLQF